ncbi:MAG TPA: hypothetical protein VJ547_05365 [Candidatus Thermoplasmatota archaeon]|nr:hypothetical protein [Candidatus Thermoplasmatota archaeon]
MATAGWRASYPFVRIPAPQGAREQGFEFILTPIVKIEIANLEQRERFFAVVDSGADYSYLPSEAAQLLGLDAASLTGSTVENRGIGATVESRFATLGVSLLGEHEEPETTLEIPFLVPVHPDPESRVVLLGRHPFFRLFDVRFRMGYTDDPTLGKWSLERVVKRRDSRRYWKPAAFPRPANGRP